MKDAKRNLDLAARAAFRAWGDVEPNPMVGAVLVREGRIIGAGHHRRFGGPHAEREAIADCLRRGESPRGATLYVTLEPCRHHGKTPPCTDAVLEHGVARVVYACPDPNGPAAGGADVLAAGGVSAERFGGSGLATLASAPFRHRLRTGLPLVLAKWAQTIDGRIATSTGASSWISAEPARRRVHRIRSRVDAVMVGVGTVVADDPMLTARGVPRVRRTARRVVIDPRLRTPLESRLVRTARDVPTTIYCGREAAETRARELGSHGIEIVPVPAARDGRGLDLTAVLAHLAQTHGATTVLAEGGATLLGMLVAEDLVAAALVHIAPLILADGAGTPAARGRDAPTLDTAARYRLVRLRQLGPDAELTYLNPRVPEFGLA